MAEFRVLTVIAVLGPPEADKYYMAVEGKSSNNEMVVLSIRGNSCYAETIYTLYGAKKV